MAVLGQSVPAFWLAIVLILIFSVRLEWLPAAGQGGFSHYIMPSIILGWFGSAGFLRLTRSAMLDVMDSEYVKLARAKGVGKFTLVWKHAFRNALIAPLTYGGLLLAGFATGTVLTETIYALPGLGKAGAASRLRKRLPDSARLRAVFRSDVCGFRLHTGYDLRLC